MNMLNDFCIKQDIDILLLQEVTHNQFEMLHHRNSYINIGTEGRGTAIITKEDIELREIQRLPSGRGIAGRWNSLLIVNVYAPSGTGKKRERDEFYVSEVPQLLQRAAHDYVIGGDFNCVTQPTDCTGPPSISKPLEALITRCRLIDAWDSRHNTKGYTHYTTHGATRIDRIYMSQTMHRNKINTAMLIAAFTDHNAVQLHLRDQQKQPLRGPSTWKLNTNLLHMEEAQDRFYEQWDIWKQKKIMVQRH